MSPGPSQVECSFSWSLPFVSLFWWTGEKEKGIVTRGFLRVTPSGMGFGEKQSCKNHCSLP